jgi:hypothetical protein
MYLYVFVSTLFISSLILKSCCNRKNNKYNFEDRKLTFSNITYLKNVDILSYFSLEKNFNKLERILDKKNGIFEKIKKLINDDNDINKDFKSNKDFFNNFYPFEIEPKIITTFNINTKKIGSSFGQLNFFYWLLENDYLLHIE